MKKLLQEIALRLAGIEKEDMTTAEQQIAELLSEGKFYLFFDEIQNCYVPTFKS